MEGALLLVGSMILGLAAVGPSWRVVALVRKRRFQSRPENRILRQPPDPAAS